MYTIFALGHWDFPPSSCRISYSRSPFKEWTEWITWRTERQMLAGSNPTKSHHFAVLYSSSHEGKNRVRAVALVAKIQTRGVSFWFASLASSAPPLLAHGGASVRHVHQWGIREFTELIYLTIPPTVSSIGFAFRQLKFGEFASRTVDSLFITNITSLLHRSSFCTVIVDV